MESNNGGDFVWGGWLKPYQYILGEMTEATIDKDRISRKIAAIVNEFADNLSCGSDHCDLPHMQSYSGRGMYGKYCLGVSVGRYDMDRLLKEFKQKGIPEPSKDTLGMGAILYWQNIPHDPKIHINHHVKEEVAAEAYAPLDTKGIVGAFTEATHKKRFEYRNSTDSWGKSHGLPHEVCVSYSGDRKEHWRVANVKGTVCYIAVDEGADGKPVMEKWAIRNHVKYVKAESVEVTEATQLLNESEGDWIIRFSRFPYQSAQKMKEKAKYVKAVVSTTKDYVNPDEINGTIIYSHNLKYPIDFSNLRRMTQLLDKIKGPNGTFSKKIGTTAFGPGVIRNPFGEMESVEFTEAATPAAPTHGYKVGDILFGSTYYGMIIPHFYKVTRLIGATKIEVVELTLQQNGDGWSGQATPSSTPKSAAKIFAVKKSGSADPGIKINNYLTAQKWDGKAAMYNYLD